jgi:hypothetical protein
MRPTTRSKVIQEALRALQLVGQFHPLRSCKTYIEQPFAAPSGAAHFGSEPQQSSMQCPGHNARMP